LKFKPRITIPYKGQRDSILAIPRQTYECKSIF